MSFNFCNHMQTVAIILEVSALLQNIRQYILRNKILFVAPLSKHIIITPKERSRLSGWEEIHSTIIRTLLPEQAQQAFLDWRTDQWSLGPTLFLLSKPNHTATRPIPLAPTCTHFSISNTAKEVLPLSTISRCPSSGRRFSHQMKTCAQALPYSASLHGKGELDFYKNTQTKWATDTNTTYDPTNKHYESQNRFLNSVCPIKPLQNPLNVL